LTRPFLQPLLPSGRLLASCGLTYGLARLLGAPPLLSLLLVPLSPLLLVPLVQDSLKPLIGGMQSALTTLFSHLGVSPSTSSSSSSASEYGCAGLLRELVLSQQKTMFYTVTVSSTPPSLKDITKKIAPNLKWQCACALSRSQSVIKRTNNNSTRYYTITYMGDLDTECSSASQESLTGSEREKEKDYSPVRIYIKS